MGYPTVFGPGFCDRDFAHSYSAALSFPSRDTNGTSGYRFEYNLHLIKILVRRIRESNVAGTQQLDHSGAMLPQKFLCMWNALVR